jgi:polar amino acid transport system substrate-binding protein
MPPGWSPEAPSLIRHADANGGQLRVALNVRRPPGSRHDLAELHISVGRELSQHLGLSFSTVGYISTRRLLRGAPDNEWDVAFLPIGADRFSSVDFTPAYLQVESVYLVAATTTIRSAEDADQPDVRIAVIRDSPSGPRLAHQLRHARLRPVASEKAAIRYLSRGEVDAIAGFRNDLLRLAHEMEGYWVLMEPLFEVPFGLAVPRGEDGLLTDLASFVDRARKSGLIEQQIDRHQLIGVRVADGSSTS